MIIKDKNDLSHKLMKLNRNRTMITSSIYYKLDKISREWKRQKII